MYDISIKVKNYKCFGNKPAGFDRIARVNLIIGKNNSGKSSLLDVIEQVVKGKANFDQASWVTDKPPEISFGAKIPETAISIFPKGRSGGLIGMNHQQYGRLHVGRFFKWRKFNLKGVLKFELIDYERVPNVRSLTKIGDNYSNRLAQNMPIPLEGKRLRKVSAERNIKPEPGSTTSFLSDGTGITQTIQHFINDVSHPSKLVEIELFNALKEIFADDAKFERIVCQRNGNNWEIYLDEEHKGRVALSKSGSGLKTVIMVLACLFLAPKIDKAKLKDYIFAFEELENNIHPALLRRLVNYIDQKSKEHGFIYFLTTHSSVLIDQFSKQDDAQIIHVTQKNSVSQCQTVQTHFDNKEILSDLDVRASDLLQSNGIIWVEGPSDRIYLNKWIELWNDETKYGKLREGLHYQIMFYGGSNIAHLSAGGDGSIEDDILILKMNHNAIILMDSDKRAQQTPLKPEVKRIQKEFKDFKAFCWVTKGKEIENYISEKVVDDFLKIESSSLVGKYESFFDHLVSLKAWGHKQWKDKKPELARRLTPLMTLENMNHVHDLDKQMKEVCKRIRLWNGLENKNED